MSQLIGTALGLLITFVGGMIVYGALKATLGLRLSQEEKEEEYNGADLSISHKPSSTGL